MEYDSDTTVQQLVDGDYKDPDDTHLTKFERAAKHIILQKTFFWEYNFEKNVFDSEEDYKLKMLVNNLLIEYGHLFNKLMEKEEFLQENFCISDYEKLVKDVLRECEEEVWVKIGMLLAFAIKLSQRMFLNGVSVKRLHKFAVDVGTCIELYLFNRGKWHDWEYFNKNEINSFNKKVMFVGFCLGSVLGLCVTSVLITVLEFGKGCYNYFYH